MREFFEDVRKIGEKLGERERKRRELAGEIRKAGGFGLFHTAGEVFKGPIKIAAVDGGIVRKSLHEFDFLITRSVGVCFDYENGKTRKVDYYPSKNTPPKPVIFEDLSEIDWLQVSNITRQLEEVRTALDCIDAFQPGMLLMDGLIMPYYLDRPASLSPASGSYSELAMTYRKLYSKCVKSGILLAGIVEDSRNNSFCSMIADRIREATSPDLLTALGSSRDTAFLNVLLKRGERTLGFRYREKSKDTFMHDFEDFAERIYIFFLKTADADRPIKVDTLVAGDEPESHIEKLSSILLSVSGHNPLYGIPAPIIEADNRAKIPESDMEILYSQMLKTTGSLPGITTLRREQRPF